MMVTLAYWGNTDWPETKVRKHVISLTVILMQVKMQERKMLLFMPL